MRPDSLSSHAMEELPKEESTPGPWNTVIDVFYPTLIRFLVGLLIAVFCFWMVAGGTSMAVALAHHGFGAEWATAAETAIIDGLILLALLEVIRTFQAYLKLGRVRVTFIIDTALVMLIGELMGLWFRAYTPEKVLLALFVIVTLTFLRILTGRFSPDSPLD
jgi:uncharacterized membrane protein (DUF373 family)